ncbi:MAG: hypothetical protein ACRDNL_12565 [Spirillospora sp.]
MATLGVPAALGALAAGCGGESGTSGRTPPVAISTAASQPATVRVGVPDAERRQLTLAEEKLIQQCMKQAGFTYTFTPPKETGPQQAWQRTDDVTGARQNGYGILQALRDAKAAEGDPHGRPDDPGSVNNGGAQPPSRNDNPDTANLSSADKRRYQNTLMGTRREEVLTWGGGVLTLPVDGCLAGARKRLYGDIKQYAAVSSLADNLEGTAVGDAAENTRLDGPERRWSQCMGGKGYRFSTKEQAHEAAANLYDPARLPSRPYRKEIEQAVADAECDKQAGYSALKQQLYDQALKDLTKKHERDLLAYSEMQRKALKVAAEVLT